VSCVTTAERLHSSSTLTESSCPQQYTGVVVMRSTFAFTRNQLFKTKDFPVHAASYCVTSTLHAKA